MQKKLPNLKRICPIPFTAFTSKGESDELGIGLGEDNLLRRGEKAPLVTILTTCEDKRTSPSIESTISLYGDKATFL